MNDYWSDANQLRGDLHRETARANNAERELAQVKAERDAAQAELGDAMHTLGKLYVASLRAGRA